MSAADFVPDEINGKVIIYEYPNPNLVDYTIFTCDPAEDDDVEKTRDTSNLSLIGLAKPLGVLPARLIVEYCDRPKKLVEFYQQVAYILLWYKGKVHVETNKGGYRMLQWFEENYPELLAWLPGSYKSARGGVKLEHGYKITTERKIQMKSLGDAYVENYVHHIPSLRLIEELKVLGALGKDDDAAMAFLAGLMILQGTAPSHYSGHNATVRPNVNYSKSNGRIEKTSPSNIQAPPDYLFGKDQKFLPQKPQKSRLFKI